MVEQKRFANCCEAAAVREDKRPTGERVFEVKRLLVDLDYRVYRVTEVVGENGEWQMSGREPVAMDGTALGRFLLIDR
jgi:hypothetical protein